MRNECDTKKCIGSCKKTRNEFMRESTALYYTHEHYYRLFLMHTGGGLLLYQVLYHPKKGFLQNTTVIYSSSTV